MEFSECKDNLNFRFSIGWASAEADGGYRDSIVWHQWCHWQWHHLAEGEAEGWHGTYRRFVWEDPGDDHLYIDWRTVMTGRDRGGVVTMSRGDELAHCTAICHHLYWQRPSDSHHKIFVYHLYKVGPTSKTLSRHCINVIQIFCDCFAQTHNTCDIPLWDYQKHCHDYGSLLGRC